MQYKKYVTLQYNSAEFLEFLKVFFSKHPCLLCGKVHKFYNHGQIVRLIRDNQTYTNRAITIFVACCPNNKKTGKQFTKRILPPFVIPESNITLENCLLMFEEHQETSFSYDLACQILGTYCERTVRRHYLQLTKVLEQTISWALAWLASHPLIAVLPGRDPGATVYETLLKIIYRCTVNSG